MFACIPRINICHHITSMAQCMHLIYVVLSDKQGRHWHHFRLRDQTHGLTLAKQRLQLLRSNDYKNIVHHKSKGITCDHKQEFDISNNTKTHLWNKPALQL